MILLFYFIVFSLICVKKKYFVLPVFQKGALCCPHRHQIGFEFPGNAESEIVIGPSARDAGWRPIIVETSTVRPTCYRQSKPQQHPAIKQHDKEHLKDSLRDCNHVLYCFRGKSRICRVCFSPCLLLVSVRLRLDETRRGENKTDLHVINAKPSR